MHVDLLSKIRVFPSEILLLTLDLENFVTASKHVIINLADVQTVINWTVVDQLLSWQYFRASTLDHCSLSHRSSSSVYSAILSRGPVSDTADTCVISRLKRHWTDLGFSLGQLVVVRRLRGGRRPGSRQSSGSVSSPRALRLCRHDDNQQQHQCRNQRSRHGRHLAAAVRQPLTSSANHITRRLHRTRVCRKL